MAGLNKRQLLKRMRDALENVKREIASNASRGGGDNLYARGLSSEGFAGGYAEALRDVNALLTHGHPSDSRGYWRTPTTRTALEER